MIIPTPNSPAYEFQAEASDLGFKPGQWPSVVKHDGVNFYRYEAVVDREGDMSYVIYRDSQTRRLIVFND